MDKGAWVKGRGSALWWLLQRSRRPAGRRRSRIRHCGRQRSVTPQFTVAASRIVEREGDRACIARALLGSAILYRLIA
jgi:hypothetical protein